MLVANTIRARVRYACVRACMYGPPLVVRMQITIGAPKSWSVRSGEADRSRKPLRYLARRLRETYDDHEPSAGAGVRAGARSQMTVQLARLIASCQVSWPAIDPASLIKSYAGWPVIDQLFGGESCESALRSQVSSVPHKIN